MKPTMALHARAGRLARYWRRAMLALGAVLVLALLVSSDWQAGASLSALRELQMQAERTGRLDSLMIQMADAESSVRGYLLSRQRAYLEPYYNSLATIEYTLEGVRQDLGAGREDQDAMGQLSGLITLKLRILAEAVEQGRVGDEAPRGTGSSEGQRYMDSIRKTLAEIKGRMVAHGQRSLDESIHHVDRTRWVVAALSGGALALLATLFVLLQRQFLLRERVAGMLQREKQRLDSLVQERTAELSELASYLSNARESEKARLARELHDELGALLTAARMDAAWVVRKLEPAALAQHRERLERLLQTLDGGIALKRRIIDDLRPPLLKELGLVAALRGLAEDFASTGEMPVDLELPDGEPELSAESALALFRIAQEALTNIRRHAQAGRVGLRLELGPERIALEVEDDGRGFDPARAGHRRHGLAGMRHRVQMLRGEFAIASRPGEGTRITAHLPRDAAVQAPPGEGAGP